MHLDDPAHRISPTDFESDPDQIPFDFDDDVLPRTTRSTLDVLGPRGTRYVLEIAVCARSGVLFAHRLRPLAAS